MADVTLKANSAPVSALSNVPKEGSGEQRRKPNRRFKRSDRHATLLDELFPKAAPDDYEVYMELVDGLLIGVAIVDARTSEIVARVEVDDLTQQAEHPGLIFERTA